MIAKPTPSFLPPPSFSPSPSPSPLPPPLPPPSSPLLSPSHFFPSLLPPSPPTFSPSPFPSLSSPPPLSFPPSPLPPPSCPLLSPPLSSLSNQLILGDDLSVIEALAKVCKDHHAELACTLIQVFCHYNRAVPIITECITKSVQNEGLSDNRTISKRIAHYGKVG